MSEAVETPTIHTSILYDAATNALASDASSDNTYSKMTTASFPHESKSSFYAELKQVELLIKKEYKITTMPIAWRSAKSIVLTAMMLALPFSDANGLMIGKTAMQAAIKAEKKPKIVISNYEEINKKIQEIALLIPSISPSYMSVVKTALQKLIDLC